MIIITKKTVEDLKRLFEENRIESIEIRVNEGDIVVVKNCY